MNDEIEVNGVKYVKKDITPAGNRAVVVVDRGWIFAGDLSEAGGRIRLDRAVHVFRWERVGFEGVIADPSKADIRRCPTPVDIPADAEIFRQPVSPDWGL